MKPETCVELLGAAMARHTVIPHRDRPHGAYARGARGELDGAATVKYLYLFPVNGARLDLRLYPADTLSQARALYADPARVEGLLGLRSHGWALDPNFHFGFITKGLTWTHSSLDIDSYVAYWVERIDQLSVFRRDDWQHEVERLRYDGILNTDDVDQFERDFTNTDRNHATPRPALRLARQWDRTQASQPVFPTELRTTLHHALSALGERRALTDLA